MSEMSPTSTSPFFFFFFKYPNSSCILVRQIGRERGKDSEVTGRERGEEREVYTYVYNYIL